MTRVIYGANILKTRKGLGAEIRAEANRDMLFLCYPSTEMGIGLKIIIDSSAIRKGAAPDARMFALRTVLTRKQHG